ncbi:hypothetical protein Tco_0355168 [Tanacetum coccineum]
MEMKWLFFMKTFLRKGVKNGQTHCVGCNTSPAELRHDNNMETIVEQCRWMVNENILAPPLTASMCHKGTGRASYASVMVEVDAQKGFKDSIEIQYKDKNESISAAKNTVSIKLNRMRKKCNRGSMIMKATKDKVSDKVRYKYIPKDDAKKKKYSAEDERKKNIDKTNTPT